MTLVDERLVSPVSSVSPVSPESSVSPVMAFPAVSLEELNDAASLQTRVDRKYVLPLAGLDALLLPFVGTDSALEIGGDRSFGYESTYFDTPELGCYLDAARSRPHRYKVRSRSYLDTGTSVLEVKTRNGAGRTVKHRDPRPGHEDHRLDPAAGRFVIETIEQAVPRRGGAELVAEIHALRPTLRTSYLRSTLLFGGGGTAPSRATIDTSLAFVRLDGPRRVSSFAPDVAIVETKTDGKAGPLDRALWRAGHRPVKVSKYGTGLALLEPGLPSTKWKRTLRRFFEPQIARRAI